MFKVILSGLLLIALATAIEGIIQKTKGVDSPDTFQGWMKLFSMLFEELLTAFLQVFRSLAYLSRELIHMIITTVTCVPGIAILVGGRYLVANKLSINDLVASASDISIISMQLLYSALIFFVLIALNRVFLLTSFSFTPRAVISDTVDTKSPLSSATSH